MSRELDRAAAPSIVLPPGTVGSPLRFAQNLSFQCITGIDPTSDRYTWGPVQRFRFVAVPGGGTRSYSYVDIQTGRTIQETFTIGELRYTNAQGYTQTLVRDLGLEGCAFSTDECRSGMLGIRFTRLGEDRFGHMHRERLEEEVPLLGDSMYSLFHPTSSLPSSRITLSATEVGERTVRLNWTAPGLTGVSEWWVFRSNAASAAENSNDPSWQLVQKGIPTGSLEWEDGRSGQNPSTCPMPGTQYSYHIRAIANGLASNPSNIATAESWWTRLGSWFK